MMMRATKSRTVFITITVLLILAALFAIGIVTTNAGTNTIDKILPQGGVSYTHLDTPIAVGSYSRIPAEDTGAFADLSTVDLLNYVLSFDGIGGYVFFKATCTYTEYDVVHISADHAFAALCARSDFPDVLELYAVGRENGENVGTMASGALPYVTLHPETIALLRGRQLSPEFAAYIRDAMEKVGLAEKS